jgi:hypothetical protein
MAIGGSIGSFFGDMEVGVISALAIALIINLMVFWQEDKEKRE